MDLEQNLQVIVQKIVEAAEGYEFRSFVLGFLRPPGGRTPEAELVYRRVKAAVGTELSRLWPDREVDFDKPELRFDVSPDLRILLRPVPLFVAGRYRKLSREIPASRWTHLACKGLGCEGCHYTGNLCGPSIQDIFSKPLLRAVGGQKTVFHGLGREDTDARMLGNGRPFVIAVEHPRRRTIDWEQLLYETTVAGRGYAELLEPRIVDRSAIKLIKESAA